MLSVVRTGFSNFLIMHDSVSKNLKKCKKSFSKTMAKWKKGGFQNTGKYIFFIKYFLISDEFAVAQKVYS
jgi:hypothetical protein